MYQGKNLLTQDDMVKDLRGWGIGLIIMGIVQIVLSQYLDPLWGILLIVTGVITLLARSRGMFIALGIILLIAGLGNLLGPTGWKIYGVLQLVWGIREIVKYGKYGEIDNYY